MICYLLSKIIQGHFLVLAKSTNNKKKSRDDAMRETGRNV